MPNICLGITGLQGFVMCNGIMPGAIDNDPVCKLIIPCCPAIIVSHLEFFWVHLFCHLFFSHLCYSLWASLFLIARKALARQQVIKINSSSLRFGT